VRKIITPTLIVAGLVILSWALVRQAREIALPSSVKTFAGTPRDEAIPTSPNENIRSGAILPGAAKEEEVQIIYPSNKGHAGGVERRIAGYITSGDREEWLRMFNELLDLSVPTR
jgi:hypothetical protein